jgi:hypothetical protein
MEQWQIEAIQALLETEIKEVEAGSRVYTSSVTYGSSRYHLLDKFYDGIQVEQVDTGEKWSKRVSFASDEIPHVLKTLLTWYLTDAKQEQDRKQAVGDDDDALGDLDAHPF